MGNCQSNPQVVKTPREDHLRPVPSPRFEEATKALAAAPPPLGWLPKSVAAIGGIEAWNSQPELAQLLKTMRGACSATTVEEALAEVRGIMGLGHNLWAYLYLRTLANESASLYYGMLLADPTLLLPVAYTPTVGEACQKFGMMPFFKRGCYVSVTDRGGIRTVLEMYAKEMLPKSVDGGYECQCMVFSDGNRILGLGDLGAWGMGIPLGKLDLYTVCGGFDPSKTVPVIIDAGCAGPCGNTDGLVIRDHKMYTGLKCDRTKHKSEAGTDVNSAYYGKDSLIGEFLTAATELFGRGCLLQFEDFNTNDAFPLLAEYRDRFLCYNDDIQGTASVAIAAILGALKIQKPQCKDLISEMRSLKCLFHGAGSANLGGATLLMTEGGVPPESVVCTNSKGVIWKSEDGKEGTFRNDEQKAIAQVGRPSYDSKDLVSIIKNVKPDVLVGAVGRDPGCFNKQVIEAMLEVQAEKPGGGRRPVVFALSNPKTQAEITACDCYAFSGDRAIFGSGTRFPSEEVGGRTREPGQVNNFFIFPGMSFGAMCCEAKTITERMFMIAAEAVANSLDARDIEAESVVPSPKRIRDVSKAVATAVVVEAQRQGLAGRTLGTDRAAVYRALEDRMWSPTL